MDDTQTVVIVGGGFAGLELIKRLGDDKRYNLILVDANNYNFFPPLIYQVSAGFMEPSAISYPFRKILRKHRNTRFRLGELQAIHPEQNKIVLNNGELHYDKLVLATGAETNYFGNENIAKYSLPMKTISDALSLRNVIFTRLDRATRMKDPVHRKRHLTFVIAGAGPTGVELSGIFAEMQAHVLQKDYPELAVEDLGEIYLLDGNDTVLAPMSAASQRYTHKKLEELGVKIRLNTRVNDFKDNVVYLSDGTTIEAINLIWAAGVSAKTFEGIPADVLGPGKRMKTNGFNQVEGFENIFALGDCAFVADDPEHPQGHPQLAQPAIQQAKNLAANLKRAPENWRPFRYKDLGALAIIGRNKAVMDTPGQKTTFKGFFAWLIWIFVHIMGLVNFKNRVRTFYNWIGYYIYKDQYFRMIIKPRDRDLG